MNIVSANKLTKDYNSLRAVDSIDFEIAEGECFGFLGPNGAGKTTAMGIIHCYQKRTIDIAVPEFPDINYPARLLELLRNVGEIVHGFASFIICI